MSAGSEAVLYDIDGDPMAVTNGTPIPSVTSVLVGGGSDGTNAQFIRVTPDGYQLMVGIGAAGFPAGGIITIQGDPSGTPLPISGNITASNASVSANDGAIPGFSTLIGGSDGTNLRPARIFDADTGAGTQWVLGVGLRKSSGGGSVELGTSSDPIRTDPTGTTTQPVSGTVTANQGGSWTVAGTGNFTVVQPTASNLRAQLASETSVGTAVPSTAVQVGGSDGTNLRPIFLDSSGRQIIIGAAANGTAVTGNPVLIGGSDGTDARTIRTATDGTIRVDPTGTTTQPISGTVTSNQGTAAALSGYWPVRVTDGTNTMPTGDVVARAIFEKITDGTNIATVKAASTPADISDPALVVTLSPNTPTGVVATQIQGTTADGVSLIGNPVAVAGVDNDGNVQELLTDGYGKLQVVVSETSGTPVTVRLTASIAASVTTYTEYTVPSSDDFSVSSFYFGGAAAGRCTLAKHTTSTVTFVSNGDFENAGQITPWAAVTGNFTPPSPDSNSTQFQTGAASMRWIYTNSATALARRQTFGTAQDFSGYRYIRVKFFHDAPAATTRTISIVLASGTSTRTYSLSGTAGTSPFTNNTWVTLTGELENPTSSTGTNFDLTAITTITLQMQDAANRSGTVYWDTLRLEDQLDIKHRLYTSTGDTVSAPLNPSETFLANETLYVIVRNLAATKNEFTAIAAGTLV